MDTLVENKAEWVSFPFTYAGIAFISKVREGSPALGRILSLSEGVFNSMNEGALKDLIQITDTTTREEISIQLQAINAGNSWALVELGE